MHCKTVSRMCAISTLTIAVVFAFSALGLAQAYKQTNLDSDIQGLAQNPPNGQRDTQLVNPSGADCESYGSVVAFGQQRRCFDSRRRTRS
jgi:hypothetical protein